MRRRISFKSTKLAGSSRKNIRDAQNAFQDDVKFKILGEIPQGNEPDWFVSE
jgi:hypothetical protein